MSESGNPRIPDPADALTFCDPGPGSLAEDLADTVNEARQIAVDLGMRPYRVLSVLAHWSGGERGRGDVTRVSERELLPRPKVEPRTRRELREGGIVERGVLVLTEINPELTEDQVMDLFYGQALGPGDEAWLEVVMDSRDGAAQRRRFVVEEPPVRRADQFDWRAVLREQDQPRTRAGRVPYAGR